MPRRGRARQNVSFYVITPEGLSATHRPDDNLIALANDTDGIAIVNTNDLTGGMKKIFECTFPPSINVLDILGTPLLLRTLPHICFGPAHGSRFGPDVLENAVDCLE